MLNILYTIIIFPIEQIIELGFVFVYRVFDNPVFAIIGVSVIVSTLTLPLYFMAERIQNRERDIQKRMKPDTDNIKAVFNGDERFMRLNTYYRQQGYHPLYSLRSSISLFIQIPFFIAAFNFLSNLSLLSGQSFFFIKNLAAPDAILNGINILPVLMTLINVISALIYTKGLPFRDKIQLYGMAALFLILLYNSPSALVLYWTCNNLYSLIKNILQKTKHAKIIVIVFVYLLLISFSVYFMIFFPRGLNRRLLVVSVPVIIMLIPLWKKLFSIFAKNTGFDTIPAESINKTFFLSLTGFFVLIGLFNPSGLIASSVGEFSYLSQYSNPLAYIGITALQGAGIALWLICIYFLLEKKLKNILSVLLTVILGIFMLNSLSFPKEYEHMLPELTFANFTNPPAMHFFLNILYVLIISAILIILYLNKRKFILFSLQVILIFSLFIFSLYNILKINGDFKDVRPSTSIEYEKDFEKQFTFSVTGKNLLVIILDRGVSGYVPVIFEEKPELLDSFRGFTYYPNMVSSGRFTLQGMPPTLGGYYYSAYEIHKRDNESQWKKLRESSQIIPRIMAEAGFIVTGDNLPFINPSVFDDNDNITAGNKIGTYSNLFIKDNSLDIFDYYQIFSKNLIRFSFLKASPLFLHRILYDRGDYLTTKGSKYSKALIDNYSSLYYLPETTLITDKNENYASIFSNDLPHTEGFLQVPEYSPSREVTNRGDGPFSNEDNYHVNMASFMLLARWFDYLKENGVYDNTRIIIASDHGNHYIKPVPNDIMLPNNRWLRYYNTVLLLKDFDSDFSFSTDYTFMTNADILHLAAHDIVETLINPFTGLELTVNKDNGFFVTSNMNSNTANMKRYTYNIKPNEWLHVHSNIFDPDNWRAVNIE